MRPNRSLNVSAAPKKNGPVISYTSTPGGTTRRRTALGSRSKSSTGSWNSCVSALMFVTSAMRRMNRNAASTIPTSIATVRRHSGEQRLDGAEQRDRERRAREAGHLMERDRGKRGSRQGRVDDAEPAADRVHRQVEQLHHGGRHDERHEWTRDAPVEPGPEDDDRQRGERHRYRPRVQRAGMGRDRPPAPQEFGGHGALEAEEILDVPRKDDQGDSAGAAEGDGVGAG